MVLIYLSCAWLAGIFLGSKLAIPLPVLFSGLVPLLLFFLGRQYRKAGILASLCLITLFSGILYYQFRLPVTGEHSLQFYNDSNSKVEILGLVASNPEPGDTNTRLLLSVKSITAGGESHNVTGNALIIVPRYSDYGYGDVIVVTGQLETPPQLAGFDYRDFLANQGISSVMFYPGVEIKDTGKGFKPLALLYSFRNRFSQSLGEVLTEPQASLTQGVILGIRTNIPVPIKDDFIHTGTAHILAISGQNLTIVAGILLGLGIWLFGKRGFVYVWLALFIIWLYALLTGMEPSVLRAAIMASLFLAAELLGRQRSAVTALVLAAAIMVGISPQVLRDAAFQLSFMSMAGLIFIFPLVQSATRKAVKLTLGEEGSAASAANFVADSFSVSLGATIAVWPLIAYYFGIISWVSPLATFVALPALPGIIISGFIAGGLGLFILPVAQVVAWITWLFASYLLLVVKVFAIIPFTGKSSIDNLLPWLWAYYLALTLVILLASNWQRAVQLMSKAIAFGSGLPVKWVVPPVAAIAMLVSVTAFSLPDNNLHISFLDVGQGSAVLIQKGSQQILVDGGPSPQAISQALGKKMPFWDRTIDLAVLTHPHADHITGLLEVLDRYKVEQALSANLTYDSVLYTDWLGLLREKGIKTTVAQAGQHVTLGEAEIEVLNPQTSQLAGTESDIDNNGVVLHLKIGKVSFLLTGDIIQEAEFDLISRRASLASTVLEVPHHGSNTSTTTQFLAVVSPQLAVISVGAGNSFGHPTADVVSRLEQSVGQQGIYRTSDNGTIEFITDGNRLWVKTGG